MEALNRIEVSNAPLLGAVRPDVAVVDMRLEDGNGLDVVAELARDERLQAPGAHSEMLALTIAHGTQEFDQRTLQIHQAPNTSSNLLYKNALLDKAKTIFSGLIVVDPDAQKTDAKQSNRNLLLSGDAIANSNPQLEIFADDVKCTHGSTVGQLDDDDVLARNPCRIRGAHHVTQSHWLYELALPRPLRAGERHRYVVSFVVDHVPASKDPAAVGY